MRIGIIVLALAALPALLGAGCSKGDEKGPRPGASAGREGGRQGGGRNKRPDLAFAVDVMPVEAKKVEYVVTAPGTIEAFERVQVTARVAGVVDKVAFSEGQEVKKGDVLVVVDAERYWLAVKSAKAAVDKADAAVRDMEAMVARREGASTKNPGLIPGEELETYRSKVLSAKADREVSASALKSAQLNLRDSQVRAPMSGVIQTRTVETGQYVSPGYVMATLLRAEPLLLRFEVEPQEAPRIKPGMAATFTMRETLRTFSAKITLVSAAADPVTHMVPVTGEVVDDGHKYWLRPGSFCDVKIDLQAQRDAPVIPRLAVRATDHGYVVYVIENDAAHERVVKLGMSTKDGWVEVRSGLAAGDQLVVRGAEALSEGAKVRPTQITPADLAGDMADKGATDAGAPPPGDADAGAPGDGGAESPPATEAGAGSPDGGRRRKRRDQGAAP